MFAELLQLAVCQIAEVDGCTPCVEIPGTRKYYTELLEVCVCTDEKQQIELIDGTLACGDVPLGKIVDKSYELIDSPCGEGLYFDPERYDCSNCTLGFEHTTDNGLCISVDGAGWLENSSQCALGYDDEWDEQHEHITDCIPCPKGEYSIKDEGEQKGYHCGTCNDGEYKYQATCIDINTANCRAHENTTFAGYQSCHCQNYDLPIYNFDTKVLKCGLTCSGVKTTYTGYGLPSIICHEEGKTIFNTTCPPEAPLKDSTGLCTCEPGYGTYINAAEPNSSCAKIYLESYLVTECNPDALAYFVNSKGQGEFVCAQKGKMADYTIVHSVCTMIDAYGCTKCEAIPGAYEYKTEKALQCQCKDVTQQIQVVDDKLQCAFVEPGYYIDGAFNKIRHTCADEAFFDIQRKRCTICDKPYEIETVNDLCVETDGVVWIDTGSRCYLGFGAVVDQSGELESCKACHDGEFTITSPDNLEVCGVCGLNEARIAASCIEFTDENCEHYEPEMKAGFKRCKCASGDLPLYSVATTFFVCDGTCNGDETIFTGAGIPGYICHQNGKTIMNTTCPEEFPLDPNTGLCSCDKGYATAVKKLASGVVIGQSICTKVLLDSQHVVSCNEHALYYYESDKLEGEVFCAQTGNMSIYTAYYKVCGPIEHLGCTKCTDIPGTYEIHTEEGLLCNCKDRAQMIKPVDGKLACADVPLGHFVNQTTFNEVDTNCSEGEYFDYMNEMCCDCELPFQIKTDNGLCVAIDGAYGQANFTRCYLGFAETFDDGGFVTACDKCPADEYSIEYDKRKECGKCPTLQHHSPGSCTEFTDSYCASLGFKAAFGKCVCEDGDLPYYSLKTTTITCNYCEAGTAKTVFTGTAVPAFVCHKVNQTILNTTCPKQYPLNVTTGLCSCPEGYATMIRRLEDGTLFNDSICAPILLDSYEIRHCNQHAMFAYRYLKDEKPICAQSGNMNLYDQYHQVCTIVDTIECTRCRDIEGARTYYTEMKQFCVCTNPLHMIEAVNGVLKCEIVPQSYVVDSKFNLVDNTCDNTEHYYDYKNNKCTPCEGPMKKKLDNYLCEATDGYWEYSVYQRCHLDFEEVLDKDGQIIDCKQCADDQYSIEGENGKRKCGICGAKQFRDAAFCRDFTKENCGLMDVDKSMVPAKNKNQCLCPDNTLPLYSLKTRMYICGKCSGDDIPVKYNGAGLPAYLCRKNDKTILNTSCITTNPLDQDSGLCRCGDGQATVAHVLNNGTVLENSYCADVTLSSYHVKHCNKGALFVFEYKGSKTLLCRQRGASDLWVIDTPSPEPSNKLTAGAIAGIVIGCLVVLAAIAFVVYWFAFRNRSQQSSIVAGNAVKEDIINQQMI